MKAPFLSTQFSESGKKAKKRFENILSTDAKRKGALILMCAIVLVGIVSLLVGKKNDAEQTTAVITEDTPIYFDSSLTALSDNLKAGDLVGILYKHNEDIYYIRRAVTEIPAIEGYVSKDKLNFDFSEANQGVITSDLVYNEPFKDKGNPEIDAKGKVCTINDWYGDWWRVSLPGGIDDVWVPAEDISYELVFDTLEVTAGSFYKQIKDYVQKKYTEAYKPHYDATIVEYLSDYKETYDEKSKTIEAEFVMNAKHRNYYKDPDSVKYIQDAKKMAEENDNEYYQKLYKTYYNEYNEIKTSNYVLKLTAKVSDDKLDEDSIKMYTNDGILDTWYELENGFGSYIID